MAGQSNPGKGQPRKQPEKQAKNRGPRRRAPEPPPGDDAIIIGGEPVEVPPGTPDDDFELSLEEDSLEWVASPRSPDPARNGHGLPKFLGPPGGGPEAPAEEGGSPGRLDELLAQAQEDPAAAIDAALAAEVLEALALLADEAPGRLEAFFRSLRKAGVKTREESGLRQAVSRERKRLKREAMSEFRARARGEAERRPEPAGVFSNYYQEEHETEEGKALVVKVGHPVQALRSRLLEIAPGWPRRVGRLLFAEQAGGCAPLWLETPPQLFAWVSGLLPGGGRNNVLWASGEDKVSEARFHAYLGQAAEEFAAVESYPHFPPLPGHFYMHQDVEPGDGRRLRELCRRFRPATDADCDLIEAFFLSLAWGGGGGSRPAWLFTHAEDGGGGRGIGKSTLPQMGARLFGGYMDVDPADEMGDIKSRLLSPDGLSLRMLLLDNVKSLKFSWAQLEALVTADGISGKRFYYGEAQRPNTLTVCITLNGASLSKDLAQRCVIVKLARPAYSATWEEETKALIDEHRWEILGDIKARLEAPAPPLKRHGRWGAWESGVLARAGEPAECQRVIAERQGEVDEDASEVEVVRDFFAARLKACGHRPDQEVVFIPSATAALWAIEASGEKRARPRACAYLNQLGVAELRRGKHPELGRGYVWHGAKAPADAASVNLNPVTPPWNGRQEEDG